MKTTNSLTVLEMTELAGFMEDLRTAMIGRSLKFEAITVMNYDNDVLGYISIDRTDVKFFPEMENE